MGIAAGLLSALLFLSLAKGISLGFLLSYAAPLPLMATGLSLGRVSALVAGATGTLAVGLGLGVFPALSFLVAAGLPAAVVALTAPLWRQRDDRTVEWYPPGRILAWLTAAALALIVIGVIAAGSHPEGAKGWVTQVMTRALEALATDVPQGDRTRLVRGLAPLFPATIMVSWLLMAVLNGVGAQALLVRAGRAARPSPVYRRLRLPDWPAGMLVLSAVASQIGDGDVAFLGANLAMVALVPFLFLGLAGIHCWAEGRPQARLALAAAYGVLVLVFVWAALAVAGLGLVRFWTMRLRRDDDGAAKEG